MKKEDIKQGTVARFNCGVYGVLIGGTFITNSNGGIYLNFLDDNLYYYGRASSEYSIDELFVVGNEYSHCADFEFYFGDTPRIKDSLVSIWKRGPRLYSFNEMIKENGLYRDKRKNLDSNIRFLVSDGKRFVLGDKNPVYLYNDHPEILRNERVYVKVEDEEIKIEFVKK